MRFKKVLLINPQYDGHYPAFLPAGLGYVAESLAAAGIEYDFFDMNLERNLRKLKSRIADFAPDLIGLQVMTFRYSYTYALIKQIKDSFPDVRIVVGGPHISTMRTQVLSENEAIDYGIVLEGEAALVELCNSDKGLNAIKGLIFRDGGRVTYNGDREFRENIDAIPFPKYEKFPVTRYPSEMLPITSSRGCPYSCIYCPVKLTIGKKMRVRTAKNVVDELKYWNGKGISNFFFTDDNFTLYRERVLAICDEIENANLRGVQLECRNGVRADKVDHEILVRMKRAGFTWLAFGVEGGNDKVLSAIKKSESMATIEEAIKNACDLGFDVDLFFLIGSPGETESDVNDSISLALRYPVASAQFYNVIPFPGTELFDWVKSNNLLLRDPADYLNDGSHWVNEPIFETRELSCETRKRLFIKCKDVSNQIRIRYFKKKLSKYGPVGGVISSLYGTSFFQNRVLNSTRLKKIIARTYKILVSTAG